MSLINDMLRDLSDKQSIREQGDTLIFADIQSSSWEQEKAARFFQQSRLPLIFISIVIFIVIFIFSKLILTQYKPSISVAPEVKPHSVVNSVELISSPVMSQGVPVDQPKAAPEAIINQNTMDSPDVQAQIYQLIDQASRAMTLDRLTSPENDNAYFYYQELLGLDAQNPVAIAGMKKITDRYLQMAEKSIQKHDIIKAEFFLDKASLVTADDIRITDIRNSILLKDQILLNAGQSLTHQENSVSVSDPFENNASLTITPNVEFLDQQAVKKAQDLIAQASKSKAQNLLENHIQLYSAPESEQYLLDLYYQDKNLTAMQTLLNSSLKMAVVDQTYYRARASILQGDNASAISLLESTLSEAASNENYRALLAGLYQREQIYVQATSAYRNLLQSFNPKPAYWLGLALSLDEQNQSSTAIHAYKKILDFQQVEPEVREYAQGRIMQLSRDH